MTGLENLRKDVIDVIDDEENVFYEYALPEKGFRPEIYAVAAVSEIEIKDLLICGGTKTYDAKIKVKAVVFGDPAGQPELLYEFMDDRIIDPYVMSGFSLERLVVGNISQDKGLGRMKIEAEILLGARTAVEK